MSLNKSLHLPYIDGLRALCALYVVFCHIAIHQNITCANLSFIEKLSVQFFYGGHYAVDFFIVLSGYSLSIKMANNNKFTLPVSSFSFLVRRAKRILIPYYFSLMLSLLLIYFFIGRKTGTHWDISLPVSYKDILAHFFLVHDLFESKMFKINHALWSISVEFRIYILFPLILLGLKYYGWIRMFIITIIFSSTLFLMVLLIQHYLNVNLTEYWPGVSPYIILFFLGMFSANVTLNSVMKPVLQCSYWLPLFFLLLVAFISLASLLRFSKFYYQVVDVVFGLLVTVFIVVINSEKCNPVKQLLSSKILVKIGSISYSIYLIHSPIIQFVWLFIVKSSNNTPIVSYYILMALSVPLIILLAYVFYVLIEKPFISTSKTSK